jgi:hypothetical protein
LGGNGFVDTYQKQANGEFKSWDQAFGKPVTKSHRLRQKRDTDSLGKISSMVAAARSKGEPIDNALFEKIGRDLGLGGATRVKELYAVTRRKITPKKRRYSPNPSK